jgi:hypothetical protein
MEGLGGYGSSDDDDNNDAGSAPIALPTAAATAASSSLTTNSNADQSAAASSSPPAAEDADETAEAKAERKRVKKEKKEKKAAKAAAAAAAAATPVSLNAPLPTPKLALPSAASLLSGASSRGPPAFLAAARADRVRDAMEAAAEAGEVIVRSEPRGAHTDAALRAIQQQAALDKAEQDRQALVSQAGDKRKAVAPAVPLAHAAVQERPSKKARGGALGADGTSQGQGPARRNNDTMEKEKLKRAKGQSGVETWKPEAWMQLRQNYDG